MFNVKLVLPHAKPRTKPCYIVQAETGKFLKQYESRVLCAQGLGLHPAYVSLIISGYYKGDVIDNKYGKLLVKDGVWAPPVPVKTRDARGRFKKTLCNQTPNSLHPRRRPMQNETRQH